MYVYKNLSISMLLLSQMDIKCQSCVMCANNINQQAVGPPGSADMVCLRPSVTLTFDLETAV